MRRQEALDLARQLAAESGELQPAGAPPLTDQMAVWLTARYLLAVRKLAEKNNGGEPDLKVLREFCHDVVALRRGDHSAARLKIEQERLERDRAETEAAKKHLEDKKLTGAQKRARMLELFGVAPEPADETATDGPESSPVNGPETAQIKPDQTESNQISLPNEPIKPGGPRVSIPPNLICTDGNGQAGYSEHQTGKTPL